MKILTIPSVPLNGKNAKVKRYNRKKIVTIQETIQQRFAPSQYLLLQTD